MFRLEAKRIGKCYKRAEFLNFLKEVDARVPEGLDIHIVMDNATLKTPKIKAWLARRPHYHGFSSKSPPRWQSLHYILLHKRCCRLVFCLFPADTKQSAAHS